MFFTSRSQCACMLLGPAHRHRILNFFYERVGSVCADRVMGERSQAKLRPASVIAARRKWVPVPGCIIWTRRHVCWKKKLKKLRIWRWFCILFGHFESYLQMFLTKSVEWSHFWCTKLSHSDINYIKIRQMDFDVTKTGPGCQTHVLGRTPNWFCGINSYKCDSLL